ncbi:hypothetical protein MKW98_005915 [Papaver atlanticum]|uniref:Uncharacterized protein n=1 Tax=Papaver atlanticum TaxID=357466 RepID=A0AAD4TE08_9MAGN|nr:hypothetical protein MKW98_005915 [Papaver atlanticum]
MTATSLAPAADKAEEIRPSLDPKFPRVVKIMICSSVSGGFGWDFPQYFVLRVYIVRGLASAKAVDDYDDVDLQNFENYPEGSDKDVSGAWHKKDVLGVSAILMVQVVDEVITELNDGIARNKVTMHFEEIIDADDVKPPKLSGGSIKFNNLLHISASTDVVPAVKKRQTNYGDLLDKDHGFVLGGFMRSIHGEDYILSLLCEEKDPEDLMIKADINDEPRESWTTDLIAEPKSKKI